MRPVLGFTAGSVSLVFVLALSACGGDAGTPATPAAASCTFTLSGTPSTFTAAGGSGSATLSTGASCAWNATVDASWVNLTGPSSGTGPATIAFTIAASSATTARSASLTVAGQALALRQDGATPCAYAITPSSQNLSAGGGTFTITIATGTSCTWSVASAAGWVTVTAGATGTGSGTATLNAAANAATDDREAAVTVAGQQMTVRQSGTPATPPAATCTYSVSPVEVTEHWHGGSDLPITITTGTGCTWTAAPAEAWLAVSPTAGSGPATILVTVPQFTDEATRRAAVQVRWPTPTAGQNVWFTQEGCRYGMDTGPAAFTAAGGTGRVTVVTQPLSASCSIGCPWTAVSNVPWIHITSSMPRAGDDMFGYQVDANSGAARTGTITMAGRTYTVNQSGM